LRLLATTIFAMLWLFLVFLLTVPVIRWHIVGRHEWLLTGLLVAVLGRLLLVGASILAVADAQQRAWDKRRWRSPICAYSGPPNIRPSLAQHGNVTMKSLEVSLICEEEATFMQGTDIRTEVREVYRHSCATWHDFRIEPAIPFNRHLWNSSACSGDALVSVAA